MSLLLLLQNTPDDQLASLPWVPDVDDVGALLRARTKVRGSGGGEELGTFLDDGRTRPTATQVNKLIAQAAYELVDALGDSDLCNDALNRSAVTVVALGTAMAVELSFFPDQIRTDQSPYEALERRYKDRLARLIESVSEQCGGGSGASVAGHGMLPTHTFPPALTGDFDRY